MQRPYNVYSQKFQKLGLGLMLLFLPSCQLSEPRAWLQWWSSQLGLTPEKAILPAREPAAADFQSEGARRARENAEILNEMIQVVFQRNPTERGEFGNWADTLNQGASFEGVYNGFVHSSSYHELEMESEAAKPTALQIFGEEMDILGKKRSSSGYTGQSLFVLKRVLGDAALQVIDEQKASVEQLAFWYSQWVLRMNERKVDFGLSLRNSSNQQFHLNWARMSSIDRIKWEVLNRIHRTLNEAQRR